ncbi:MAG: hypothetical protein JNL82_40640 [Myxococcales bacterium]|nr:hypothetical protein [Myxococcales bacterium]
MSHDRGSSKRRASRGRGATRARAARTMHGLRRARSFARRRVASREAAHQGRLARRLLGRRHDRSACSGRARRCGRAPAPREEDGMRILVAHASVRGATAELARAVADELGAAGHAVDLRDVADVDELAPWDAVVVGDHDLDRGADAAAAHASRPARALPRRRSGDDRAGGPAVRGPARGDPRARGVTRRGAVTRSRAGPRTCDRRASPSPASPRRRTRGPAAPGRRRRPRPTAAWRRSPRPWRSP